MTDTLTLWLGERLVTGSIQGAVVIALVWLACRLAPRIPAAAQAALWWLAALKLVLVFVPAPTVPVVILPADFARPAQLILPALAITTADPGVRSAPATASAAAGGRAAVGILSAWLPAAVLLWLALVLVHAVRLIHAHRVLRGIVRRSIAWPDDETADLARRLGLKRTPQVRLSGEIDTPQVCGVWTPVVLVPAETMHAFTAGERSMTLCHELMHIRRRDLAFGWIPACAERLFFFHPLARVAAREYITAREAACDAGAMRALGVSAGDYGRLLVRLGIGSARPALSAGGSPFSATSLKRRLHMLEREGHPNVSRRWGWAVAIAAAALIPMQLVARTPAAPPQDTVTLPELVKAAQTAEERADLERAKAILAGAELAVLEKKLSETSLREPQEKLTEMNRARLEIASAMARVAEQTRGQAAQADQAAAKRAEMMAQIEKARQLQREAAADQKARTLGEVLTLMLEKEKVQKEELASQIRRLAERLERLATEQRELTEELKQLERLAAPVR